MDILHRLQQILGMVQDVVLVVSSSGTVAFASASIQTVLEVDPQSIVNRNILELNHPEDALHLRATLARSSQQRPPSAQDHGHSTASQQHYLRFRHQWGSDYCVMLVKCQPLTLRSAAQLEADGGATYLTHGLLAGFRGSGHVPLPQLKLIASTGPSVPAADHSAPVDVANRQDPTADPAGPVVPPTSPAPTPEPDLQPDSPAAARHPDGGPTSSSAGTNDTSTSRSSPGLRDDLFLLVARPYPLPPHDNTLDELLQLKVDNERLRAELEKKYTSLGGGSRAPPVGSVLREVAFNPLLVVSSSSAMARNPGAASRTESAVDVAMDGADSLDGTGAQLDRMDIDAATSPLLSPALAATTAARTGSQQFLPQAGHGSGLAGVITPSDFIDANLIAASTQGRQVNRKRTRGSKLQGDAGEDGMVCMDCGRTNSPEWRKGPTGEKCLCNACGLRYAKRKKTEKAAAQGTSLPANNPAMLRLQQQIAAAASAAASAPNDSSTRDDDDDGEPMISPTSTSSPLQSATMLSSEAPSSYLAMCPPTTSPLPPPPSAPPSTRTGSQPRRTSRGGPSAGAPAVPPARRAPPPPPLPLYKPLAPPALDHPALHPHSSPTAAPIAGQQPMEVDMPTSLAPNESPPLLQFPLALNPAPQPTTSVSMPTGSSQRQPPMTMVTPRPSWGSPDATSAAPASALGSPPSRSMSMSASLGRSVPRSGSSAGSYSMGTPHARYLLRDPPPPRGGAGGGVGSSSSSEFGMPGFGSPPSSGRVSKTTSGSSAKSFNSDSPFQHLQYQQQSNSGGGSGGSGGHQALGRTPSSIALSPPSSFPTDWVYSFGNNGGAGPPILGSGGGTTPGGRGGSGPSGWEGSLFDDLDAYQVECGGGPLGPGLVPLSGGRLWSTPSVKQQQQMTALFNQVMLSPPHQPQQPQALQPSGPSVPPSRRSHSVTSSQGGRHPSEHLQQQMPASMRGRTPVTATGSAGAGIMSSRAGTPEYYGQMPIPRSGSRGLGGVPQPTSPAAYSSFDPDLCPSPMSGPTHMSKADGPKRGAFDTFSPASYMAVATAAAMATANQQYPPQSYYSPHHPLAMDQLQEQQQRASFMATMYHHGHGHSHGGTGPPPPPPPPSSAGSSVVGGPVPAGYMAGPRPTAAQVEHMAAFMDHIRNEQMQMYQAGLSPTWANARGRGRGSSVGSGRYEQGYD